MRSQISEAVPQKIKAEDRVPGAPPPDSLAASTGSETAAAGADCELPVRIVQPVEANGDSEGLEERKRIVI